MRFLPTSPLQSLKIGLPHVDLTLSLSFLALIQQLWLTPHNPDENTVGDKLLI
jgi:hypothetical protein